MTDIITLVKQAGAAANTQNPIAWEYENEGGVKFLTFNNPNNWHNHDKLGFKNFRALTYAAAGAAPADEWRDAVLNALADHGMDAPLTDTPREIVKKLTDMVATMARDPAINAGAAPAAKVPEWMPLPSAPKGNL